MREEILRLIKRYGWNATCYQLVNPGLDIWFGPSHEAVIGFVEAARTCVVAGAPVCSEDDLPKVIAKFESEAKSKRRHVCYFGASGRIEQLLGDCHGYSTVVLGSQPVWNPSNWEAILASNSSIRAQLNRALNKGVQVDEWSYEGATNNAELQAVLQEWLSTRGLPPLHFLVEPETLSFLEGRRIFVATRAESVVGFLVASPIPTRNGWLTEQFVRGKGAVNGTIELLVDATMRGLIEDKATYVTMGLVPLSNHGFEPKFANPLWLSLILKWVRAHGRRFYNFGGLEHFKAKLQPDYWEPIYAISNERSFSLRSLYAIAAAFTKEPPLNAVMRGFVRGVRQELRWLLRKS